jgi:hypothetical protein
VVAFGAAVLLVLVLGAVLSLLGGALLLLFSPQRAGWAPMFAGWAPIFVGAAMLVFCCWVSLRTSPTCRARPAATDPREASPRASIPLDEFNKVHAMTLGNLPERILALLKDSDKAFTADEIAGELLGIKPGAMAALLAPEVQAILPTIKAILEISVAEGKIRSVKHSAGLLGQVTYYARNL